MVVEPWADSDSVRPLRRIAVLCVHSSPLDPAGAGDSGGMNVYVRAVARELAQLGVASDVYTRRTHPSQPEVVNFADGVRVIHVAAGPPAPVSKHRLADHLCAFVCAMQRQAAHLGPYELIHSHYWLSGWVGRRLAERWGVPLVHSAHTLGKVKNANLAPGDAPEPAARLHGEERVVAAADRLLAPTPVEARELVELYGAASGRVHVVQPGVDVECFTPGDQAAARVRLGIRARHLLAFVGRLQALKAPDLAVRALAVLRDKRPDLGVELVVVGSPSGNGFGEPQRLRTLAEALGVGHAVHFLSALPHAQLADVYRASDLLLMPSHSESFGLVALEAQACGLPVLASRSGGLAHAVGSGTTGILLSSRDPEDWAEAAEGVLSSPRKRRAMSAAAARFAGVQGWRVTAEGLLSVYEDLLERVSVPSAIARLP